MKTMYPNESFKALFPHEWQTYYPEDDTPEFVVSCGLYALMLGAGYHSRLYQTLVASYGVKIANHIKWNNGHCKNSSAVLSTTYYHFKEGNKTPFKIDLCLVKYRGDHLDRLVCEKTGVFQQDCYYWNEAKDYHGLDYKEDWLKDHNYWNEVRDTYLRLKSTNLSRQTGKKSFIIYAEAVNEVYSQKTPNNNSNVLVQLL